MSPQQLLRECMEAFEAIPTAQASRKMLRRLKIEVGVYAGNGSHILAREMAARIKNWLGGPI